MRKEKDNKTIVQKIRLETHYSIQKLITYPQFKRFAQNPDDIKTFKENLLNFLRKKYGAYLISGNQNYLDGILSLIKLIENGHSIPDNKLLLLKHLIYEKKINTINPIEK